LAENLTLGMGYPRGNTAGRPIETELPSVASYNPFKWHFLPTYTEKHRMEKTKTSYRLTTTVCACLVVGRDDEYVCTSGKLWMSRG